MSSSAHLRGPKDSHQRWSRLKGSGHRHSGQGPRCWRLECGVPDRMDDETRPALTQPARGHMASSTPIAERTACALSVSRSDCGASRAGMRAEPPRTTPCHNCSSAAARCCGSACRRWPRRKLRKNVPKGRRFHGAAEHAPGAAPRSRCASASFTEAEPAGEQQARVVHEAVVVEGDVYPVGAARC